MDCALCGVPMTDGTETTCDYCRVEDMVDGWDYPTDEDGEDSEVGPDHDGYYN